MHQQNFRSVPFVSSIYIPKQGLVDESVDIHFEGSWPTPAWKHVETKIEYDTTTKIAIINYLGSKKKGISIQVIKNFTARLTLIFPTVGTWSVKIMGRNKYKIAEIKIIK